MLYDTSRIAYSADSEPIPDSIEHEWMTRERLHGYTMAPLAEGYTMEVHSLPNSQIRIVTIDEAGAWYEALIVTEVVGE